MICAINESRIFGKCNNVIIACKHTSGNIISLLYVLMQNQRPSESEEVDDLMTKKTEEINSFKNLLQEKEQALEASHKEKTDLQDKVNTLDDQVNTLKGDKGMEGVRS